MPPIPTRPNIDPAYQPSTTSEVLHLAGAVVVGGAGFIALQGIALGVGAFDLGAGLVNRARDLTSGLADRALDRLGVDQIPY